MSAVKAWWNRLWAKKRAALIVDSADMKMLGETLRIAQSRCHRSPHDRARIQVLLNEVNRHRPVGSDGKHGDRHTRTCGCEDR